MHILSNLQLTTDGGGPYAAGVSTVTEDEL
jgi:hypothetical protein